MKPFQVYALDLGTTKFCLASLQYQANSSQPRIETLSVNAEGMRRGMLADFDKAEGALTKLIEIAEKEFKTRIAKVVVGIAGSHLQSSIDNTTIPLAQGYVKAHSLNTLQKMAQKTKPNFYKENLHAIPLNYQLDDREWTSSPIGFSGRTLTGQFFRIEADKNYMSDVVNLCNRCGLEVSNLYAEPYASASVTLSEQEKEYGVMIADIGGGTTDGIIYSQGTPVKLFTINIGGVLMTHDLSLGLGLPYDAAEQLKLSVGLDKKRLNQNFSAKNIHDKTVSLAHRDLYMILFARVLELSRYIKKELDSLGVPLKAGVVLTGGGAEVVGLPEVMSYILKVHVKKMLPDPCKHLQKGGSLENDKRLQLASKYSTVSGMLLLEALEFQRKNYEQKPRFFEKYVQNFMGWVRELS